MKEWGLLEKQVFFPHYFLTMPIWRMGAAATDSLPATEQTGAERLTGKKWDGDGNRAGEMSGIRFYPHQNKVKTCVEEAASEKERESLKLKLLRFHTDPQVVKVRYEARVQSNLMEVKAGNINIHLIAHFDALLPV